MFGEPIRLCKNQPRKANVIRFPGNGESTDPHPPDPSPVAGCRPAIFLLEDHRHNILLAIRKRRDRRSIAAQYGLHMDELFEVAADRIDELERRAA